ncbi:MAG: AAA domain-containing protein [Chitinivibrionales bacterium]|nr:AAA domain-containing protein [Chitinivibrionales bacterium]
MNSNENDIALIEGCLQARNKIKAELQKKIIGQTGVIDDLLACFLAGGHCLLIGVPGLAKTMLVQSLSQCLDCSFNRVQFTPDLMPSDITGSEILFEDRTSGRREFRFVKGPVFTNILLADEINRTPPKTQSALLQAMQEYEVTSAGKTFPLPAPFWVLATQNPIEQEGTYPLPEAQQDRFMFSIEIDYPEYASEMEIVKSTTRIESTTLKAQLGTDDIGQYRELVRRVPVADSVVEHAVGLVRRSRPNDDICPDTIKSLLTWGAGPRASQYCILAARAYAILDGRPTPDISDVNRAAPSVLRHRLVRSFNAETENVSANDIVGMLLEKK